MSIVFSAIVPHPLILIPTIGKENAVRIETTGKSYKKLSNDLAKTAPDTIIIISPHGIIQENAFSMNLNPVFNANFEQFGDFSTKLNFKGDVGLSYKIKEKLETKIPLQLVSDEVIDYGTSIPLYFLASGLANIKIIPIYYSGLGNDIHFKFGQLLQSQLLNAKENIAVIASGDLSHRLNKHAPGGYSVKAKKFDKKIIDLLLNGGSEDVVNLPAETIAEAGECGLKSIITLLGIIDGIKHEPQLYSYEYPFGVGYMVMNFKL